MDDMIRMKNTKFVAFETEIDTLKQTLSKHVKGKESLLATLNGFKTKFKERESKSIDKEIVLENKNKELENIVCKLYQSTQAMHMLTKPQVFYDNTHKQALGYQNPFYLKRAQRIKPILYDGNVLSKTHDVLSVVDDEETLILAEESRLKMVEKQNDPIMKKEKINITPINYSELNKLAEDFVKRFVPQQELSTEQMFWLITLRPLNKLGEEPSTLNKPVKIEVPSELPKVSLVNKSLKKLRFHLASFDKVVKVRTTPDAITEGSWDFEHTKKVFLTEIIPWLNKLKDFFKEFDKGLLDEITEVQTIFTQMEAVVEQCSVDRKSELVNKNNVYIELSKRFSNLKQHCISLEVAKQLNKEIFQKYKSSDNQNHPKIQEYFEQNDLKAQLQAKDTVISKLKETIHSLRENASPAKVKKDIDEIETINIKLEHSVAKLLSENEKLHKEKEHLKKTYKELYDSIEPSRVHAKEQCDSLIANLNSKSMENAYLKTQFQEKLNLEPLAPKVLKNKDAHLEYIKHSREHADILREIVENDRALSPLDSNLDSA
ncbi:hypothetical protein Tco_0856351, partial [Tanacetum coccineum]